MSFNSIEQYKGIYYKRRVPPRADKAEGGQLLPFVKHDTTEDSLVHDPMPDLVDVRFDRGSRRRGQDSLKTIPEVPGGLPLTLLALEETGDHLEVGGHEQEQCRAGVLIRI